MHYISENLENLMICFDMYILLSDTQEGDTFGSKVDGSNIEV